MQCTNVFGFINWSSCTGQNRSAPDAHTPPQVRQDPRTEAFYVGGLAQARVTTPSDALSAMASALSARHTRAHRLNLYSSRSHCIMTFAVHSEDRSGDGVGGRGVRRTGKLMLVDLAGSERLRDTGSGGDRDALRETGHINKSLFTLGQVGGMRYSVLGSQAQQFWLTLSARRHGAGARGPLGDCKAVQALPFHSCNTHTHTRSVQNSKYMHKHAHTITHIHSNTHSLMCACVQVLGALSSRGRQGIGHSHIPFRDAKLTQLLWDGLRGTGRALMVACLAPLKQQAEETANTLHFAGMALRIQGEPVVTIDPQVRHAVCCVTCSNNSAL